MKPIVVKWSNYIGIIAENSDKNAKFKVGIKMPEYQNTRTFLQKVTLQIGQEKTLLFKKLKILYRGHM